MRNSFIARFAALLAAICLVLVSTTAVYAGGNGWGGWSSDSSYSKSDKSDKSDKSNKSGKSDKSDKSDKSKKSGKSDKSDKSSKSGKSDKSGKGPTHPEQPPVDPVIEGNCAVFYAGQHTAVGSVCLTIIGDTAKVDYIMEGGWTLSNPHLWVGDTLASAPTTRKGKPIPGQFPFTADISGETLYTFEIPVSELAVNADLLCSEEYSVLVAAHGEVARDGQHESAWAGETRFTKRGSWATYFGVVPPCEDPEPEPEPQVCEVAEVSTDFSSTTGGSATLALIDGVTTTFTVTTEDRFGNAGFTQASAAIIDPDLKYTLTYVNFSVLRTGNVESTLGEYSADEPAAGEFKQGVRSFAPDSVTTPEGQFTLRTQVELCEVGPQDPGPSS